jgi:hypothetical protein
MSTPRHSKQALDPIFALIEQHQRALKVQERAAAALASLKARIDARPTEQRKHEGRRMTCAAPFFDLGSRLDPAKVVRAREEIKPYVWSVFDRAAWGLGRRARSRVRNHEREATAELLRKYDAFQRAHRAARKACGLTAREEAAENADRAVWDALNSLVQATPGTPEGRTARSAHLAALSPSQAPWWALRAVLAAFGAPPAEADAMSGRATPTRAQRDGRA